MKAQKAGSHPTTHVPLSRGQVGSPCKSITHVRFDFVVLKQGGPLRGSQCVAAQC